MNEKNKEFTKSYAINRIAELLEENERLKEENKNLSLMLDEMNSLSYKLTSVVNELNSQVLNLHEELEKRGLIIG